MMATARRETTIHVICDNDGENKQRTTIELRGPQTPSREEWFAQIYEGPSLSSWTKEARQELAMVILSYILPLEREVMRDSNDKLANILGGDGIDDAAWVSGESNARRERIDHIILAVEQCIFRAENEPLKKAKCDCAKKVAAELNAEAREAKEACAKIADKYAKSSISAERVAMEIRERGSKT